MDDNQIAMTITSNPYSFNLPEPIRARSVTINWILFVSPDDVAAPRTFSIESNLGNNVLGVEKDGTYKQVFHYQVMDKASDVVHQYTNPFKSVTKHYGIPEKLNRIEFTIYFDGVQTDLISASYPVSICLEFDLVNRKTLI